MNIYPTLRMLKEISEARQTDKVVLVTSAKLKKKISWAIREMEHLALPHLKIVLIPDGEKAKDWDVLKKLLVRFTKLRLTKKSLVIALGGGSVSDLVGLACSIYKRGAVSYINIPTTLLAQVDASIGGKTAIDFEGYKNLIGSFYDPISIFIISGFLASLSEEQFIDGLAEIIKAGLIKDPVILDILESCSITGLRKNPSLLGKLVIRAIAVKEYFVSKDPKDNDIRQALNFGHTFAHALELKHGLSHGRAVLWGMFLELKAVEPIGIILEARIRLIRILEHLGINLNSQKFIVDRRSVLYDKKIFGEEISLPVIIRAGEVKLVKIRLDKLMVAIKKCN